MNINNNIPSSDSIKIFPIAIDRSYTNGVCTSDDRLLSEQNLRFLTSLLYDAAVASPSFAMEIPRTDNPTISYKLDGFVKNIIKSSDKTTVDGVIGGYIFNLSLPDSFIDDSYKANKYVVISIIIDNTDESFPTLVAQDSFNDDDGYMYFNGVSIVASSKESLGASLSNATDSVIPAITVEEEDYPYTHYYLPLGKILFDTQEDKYVLAACASKNTYAFDGGEV